MNRNAVKATDRKIFRVYLELSNTCNFKCDFCPIEHSKRQKKFMDFSLFKKAVDDVVRYQISDWVAFHVLGEPLLYPRIFDAVSYVKSRGLKLLITTNGSLLTTDTVDKLAGLEVDKISISLETNSPAEHLLRRSGLSFHQYYHQILNAIRLVKAKSKKTTIVISMMNSRSRKFFDLDKEVTGNYKEEAFKAKLASLIYDIYISINKEKTMGEIVKFLDGFDCNRPRAIVIEKNIRIFIQMFGDWGNAFTTQKVFPANFGYCCYALNNVAVLSDGRVTMCCVDYDGHTSLGNIRDNSLYSLLHNEKTRTLREGFKKFRLMHPYCRRCFGGASRVKAFFKGLVSIYLFKIKPHPLQRKALEFKS